MAGDSFQALGVACQQSGLAFGGEELGQVGCLGGQVAEKLAVTHPQ